MFITGHTSFRGSWLALTLQKAGAQVFGYALPPTTSPNFFDVGNVSQSMTSTFSDIRDAQSLKSALEFAQAEVVFHLAGGGGLKDSWSRIPDVYSTQVMGTIHLLEALKETASVRAVVILSSDKVYRKEVGASSFKETDPLGGNEPAATSKACTELIVESYLQGVFAPEKYNKHKIAIATARMGAVIGGGDFAPDSLIYQLAQSCQAGVDLPLRNPDSLRSWMHIDDAVSGLMLLGQSLIEKGPKAVGPWNVGSGVESMATVKVIKQAFVNAFQGKPMVNIAESPGRSVHGGLDNSKIEGNIGWRMHYSSEQAAVAAAHWYQEYYSM